MTDLVGVPTNELTAIASVLGAVPIAIQDFRSGDKVQIADGIFGVITAGEQVAILIDPALAELLPITRIAAILVELVLKYGKTPQINSPEMQRFDGPENPTG